MRMPRSVVAAGVVGVLLLGLAAAGQEPPTEEKPEAVPAVAAEMSGILTPGDFPIDEAEIAGLPKGSRPEVLTLRRAYDLALIRARAARQAKDQAPALSLEPKALDDLIKRHDVRDFARFRDDFTGRDPRVGFHDPSARFLDLLRRRAEVEIGRRHLLISEKLFEVLGDLAKGEASGLGQAQIDDLDSRVQGIRTSLLDAERDYGDALDEIKVELGLPPGTPTVPDRTLLSGFWAVFDRIDRWATDPKRDRYVLPQMVEQLPALPDITIDGRSSLSYFETSAKPIEELLSAAGRAASKRPGNLSPAPEDVGDRLLLRVRRRLRGLRTSWGNYQIAKRELVLAIRQKEDAQESLVTPPVEAPEGGLISRHAFRLDALIRTNGEIAEAQRRLIALWVAYQSDRLGLLRDLGQMPAEGWDGFFAPFTPKRYAGPEPPAPPPLLPPDDLPPAPPPDLDEGPAPATGKAEPKAEPPPRP